MSAENNVEKEITMDFNASAEDISQYDGRRVRIETYMTDDFEGILRMTDKDKLHFWVRGDEHYGDVEFDYEKEFAEMKSENYDFEENPKLDGMSPDIFKVLCYESGDVVRVMQTKSVGDLEKTGEYRLAEIVSDATLSSDMMLIQEGKVPADMRTYWIKTSERRTSRRSRFLEPASQSEIEEWQNNNRRGLFKDGVRI